MESFEGSTHGAAGGECNRVFYMALPPSVYIDVAKGLRENCYSQKGINRVIIEKPFGKDLESYRHLQSEISKLWREDEVRLFFVHTTPHTDTQPALTKKKCDSLGLPH